MLETDCMLLYEALKHKKENSLFGLVLNDIYALCLSCENVSFSFVEGARNQVAHFLARKSLECNEQLIWLEEAPESFYGCSLC